MARHLLDSDILISTLRKKEPVLTLVRNLLKEEVPAISAITYFEIWVGVRPHEEDEISEFLSLLLLIPVDQRTAREAANYSRSYRKKGLTLGSMDALIAATAKIHDLILVTSNVRDFPMADIQKHSF